jgi:monovalent cation/proton antiporter MnhG/PhaG subunit
VTPREVAAGILLVLGVLLQLFAVAGVVVMRDAFDRLHYAAAATTFGPFLIAGAILLEGSAGELDTKSVLVAVLLVVGNPVLTHATGRAARTRLQGDDRARTPEIENTVPRSSG